MAGERKIQVQFGSGMVDAIDVPVDESNERWTEIKLQDGAVLRVKMSVISVARIIGQWDQLGNPQYAVNATPTMAVIEVPDKLKKPADVK